MLGCVWGGGGNRGGGGFGALYTISGKPYRGGTKGVRCSGTEGGIVRSPGEQPESPRPARNIDNRQIGENRTNGRSRVLNGINIQEVKADHG